MPTASSADRADARVGRFRVMRVEAPAKASILRKGMAMESGAARKDYSGWAAFAGVVMFIVGSLDALWGLAAILNDDVVIVGGHGAIIALTGLGLLTGNTGARILAVFFLSVNAITQIVWFSSAPLWAFLLILLDVVIIYQLTARWDQQAAWD
jgi:hypothetical protein